MRSLVTTLSLAMLVLAAAPPAARAQSLLFDYVGFDYESPDPLPGEFGEAGSGYVALGTVPYLFAPLVTNTAANEYTFVIDQLTSTGFIPVGPYRVVSYSGGRIRIFEDPRVGGTLADFGTAPPNASAPGTFEDGAMILEGTLTNFQFSVDTGNGAGSFEAVFNVSGGLQFGNFAPNNLAGWTFSGSTGNALNIPSGYAHQIDGQTFLNSPTNVRRSSWGRLKAGYR